MSTQVMREVSYCFNVFEFRPWYHLIPDQGNKVLISGRGQFGSLDCVCAARTSDRSMLMAYLPVGRPVTIDMSTNSGTKARAWWYDTQIGKALLIGTFPTRGPMDSSPATKSDWLLMIEDVKLNFPTPGDGISHD